MSLAFLAGFDTRLASDAARRMDVEFVAVHQALPFLSSDECSGEESALSGCLSASRSWHADTFYSGILLRGSSVRCVSRFALRSSGQWYGMNTVSGRIVFTTMACRTISLRRVAMFTQSPSFISHRSARRGWISSRGFG